MKKNYVFKRMDSPVGKIRLVASGRGLAAILWEDDDPKRVRLENAVEDVNNAILLEAERQLKEYFAGKRKSFTIELDFAGTDFQKKVWGALLNIPCGETRTYGEIAKRIGSPKASRAVGAANGKNPISIIAACHRVIGASGRLVGYAGGLENKALLLDLEANMAGQARIF